MPPERQYSTTAEKPYEVPGRWEGGKYIPNRISSSKRTANTLFSFMLLAYGGYGVAVDDLWLPGKRGPGLHLHGWDAWLMYAAFVAATVSMLSVVMDHFDLRPNEAMYDDIEKYANWMMYCFGGLSIAHVLYSAFH